MYLPTKILRLIANGKYSTLTKSERLILPLMATNADKHTGEGVLSIGSIARLTGLARNTVKKAYRSLADRSIIQDCGNKPGHGVTWRLIYIPDLRKVTPPDTVNRCMTVLIDSTHSTRLKLCTGTLDTRIKIKTRSKKTRLKNKSDKLKINYPKQNKRETSNKRPIWWAHVANILTKRQGKTQGYRNAILKAWEIKGYAEIAHIKVSTPEEAQRLLSSQNTKENREVWVNTIQREMRKDTKPNGGKGHLAWVANHLTCEKCSARVVVFRLGGKEAGARQWGPAVLGLLQRLSKQGAGPTLVLKDDGWRKDYMTSKRAALRHRKTKVKAVKPHNDKPRQAHPTPSYPAPAKTLLGPDDYSAWTKTREALQNDLRPQSYTTWIKPLNIYHSEVGVLWLECENKYAAEFISANYVDRITAALQKIAPYQEVRLCVLSDGG